MNFPKPIKNKSGRKKLFPRSKNPRKTAYRRAWDAFSVFVRSSNADINGNVRCFTCGVPQPWREMDAGHFIHRNSLDFDEFNIHPQCTKCNRYLSGNEIEYTVKMIRLYGQEVVEDLMSRKNDIVRYGIADLLELERFYKQKVKGLKGGE